MHFYWFYLNCGIITVTFRLVQHSGARMNTGFPPHIFLDNSKLNAHVLTLPHHDVAS